MHLPMHLASRCPLKTRPEKIVGSVAVKISATGGAQPRTGMGHLPPSDRDLAAVDVTPFRT